MPPYDKQNAPRPRMPVAAKQPASSPLTPRVVGAAPATPSARWVENSQAVEPKEDLSTPVNAFLNINITPRSGSRKSRVDSANTTPSGTPTGTPSAAGDPLRVYEPPPHVSGLGIGGGDRDMQKRSVVSFSPSISENTSLRAKSQSNAGDSSKFFFASDAKTVQAKPPVQSKPSNFFYANGDSIPAPQSSSASVVGSSIGEERAQPKFFHANGSPDLQGSPHLPSPRPSSTVSTASRMATPRLAGSGTLSPPQRPSSPSKLSQQTSSTSVMRGSLSLQSPPLPRPHPVGRGQSANAIAVPSKTGTESPERIISHGRSSSLSSADSKRASRRISSGSSFGESTTPTSPLNPVANSTRISSPEGIIEEAEHMTETIQSVPQSPTKAGHSLERMNELAANARRERKVLDLEITNSSLAAINRTLEREMRKQTAELRRYRRLSRSGRLSITTSASIRTSTGLSTIDDEETRQLSEMTEEESEELSDFDSSEDSLDDGSLDPEALAASDARHRKRDEMRLQLDLSKHQQLLIDSQKLNESLKRCLGWTEGLIAEGKKALDYHVRVSDVELGGRVLVADDADENEARGGGALLPNAIEDASTWNGGERDENEGGSIKATRDAIKEDGLPP